MTLAPVQASFTSSVSVMVAPVSAATSRHWATRSAFGIRASGPQATKCRPSFAHTTMSEFATLFSASPMNTNFRPLRPCGKFSSTVSMSAIICVGWNSVVRPFHTGTPALAARSSTISWEKPRYSMPSYMRPSTRAVSSMDSFLPIWELPGSR